MSTLNKALIRLNERRQTPPAEVSLADSFEQVILGAGQIISYSATLMPASEGEATLARSIYVGPQARVDAAKPNSIPSPHLDPASFRSNAATTRLALAARQEAHLTPVAENHPMHATPRQSSRSAAAITIARSQEPTDSNAAFAPAWEIDALTLPQECEALFRREGRALEHAALELRRLATDADNVVVLTSMTRESGVTTMAMCMAAALSKHVRVALVDADLEHPRLASRLNLTVEHDWIDGVAKSIPLTEAAITDDAGQIVVFPLRRAPDQSDLPSATALAEILKELGARFDVVLVDAGPLPIAGAAAEGTRSSTNSGVSLVVRDLRHSGDLEFGRFLADLAAVGLRPLGVIENFEHADAQAG